MHMQQIPLKLLKLSPRNVRKTATGIDALAVSIAAHGLVHNLVAEKVNGHFEVIAGGRRLLALQHLEKTGHLPEDLREIRTLVIPSEGAEEVSLAENGFREPMHPADQFEAFAALLATDLTEDEVAARFSVTVQYLRQRMKLAKLAPAVIEAFRDGFLTLDAVEAFALSDDHAQHERLLKMGAKSPWQIREQLTKGEVSASDSRVKIIGGLAAYEAAGGVVRRDMFAADDDAGYVADVKLLDKLVDAEVEKKKAKLVKEGWAWVEVGSNINVWKYTKGPGKAADLDKSKYGALLSLEYGRLEVTRGVLKPGATVSASGKVTEPKAKAKDPAALSFAQVQQLQAHRDGVVALHLARNPRIALAALAARLADKVLDWEVEPVDSLIRIAREHASWARVPQGARQLQEDADATTALEEIDEQVSKDIPRGESLLAWLLTQPESRTHELLALCTARMLMSVHGQPEKLDAGAELAALLGINMADHWKISAEWLAQQPSGYIAAAIIEKHGKDQAAAIAKCKGKAGLVAHAFNLLDGRFGEPWMPAPLRAPAPPKPVAKKVPAKKAAAKK